MNDDNNPIKTNHNTNVKKSGRWEFRLTMIEILASVISLIAIILEGIFANLVSELITHRIPTSFIVVFSIVLGVIIILLIAVGQIRLQAKIRLSAIEKLKTVESDFFTNVENEISALFSERVG